MIIGLDHCQITVPKDKESEARNFYIEFMGLNEVPKPENRKANGGFWLAAGDLQLHVGLEDGVERARTKAHVAYRVDRLDHWRRKISDRGLEVIESPPFPDAKAFEFRDPFGNRVEIIERL